MNENENENPEAGASGRLIGEAREARAAALARIKAVLMPAAVALAGARDVTDPFWLERTLEVGGVRLRVQEGSDRLKVTVLPPGAPRPEVLIIDDSKVTPEGLLAVATAAARWASEVRREAAAKLAAIRERARGEIEVYERIAP